MVTVDFCWSNLSAFPVEIL